MNTNLRSIALRFCLESDIKLCAKCLYRFCLTKNFSTYKKSNTELINELLTAGDQSVVKFKDFTETQFVCNSCLGLLCDDYCDDIVTKIVDHLNSDECEHRYDTFQLLLSVPVAITLRNELLIQKLKHFAYDKTNGVNGSQDKVDSNDRSDLSTIYAVKDILRVILIDALEKRLVGKPFDTNSTFNIALDFTYKDSDNECQLFYDLTPKAFFPKKCRKSATKSFLNQSSILRAVADMDRHVLYEWSMTAPKSNCDLDSIKLTNNAIHIAGRYCKYSRRLSQTPWLLDGERLMESSVQDIIQDKVQEIISCDQLKFSASGREDVDVRMLGRGRPFILEVCNPRVTTVSDIQFREIMSAINGTQKDVGVRDLQIVSKNDIQCLKEGENEKTKTYRALCCLSRPLTDADIELLSKCDDFVIDQKTPIRVLHRRTLSVRRKHVYKLWAERVTENDVDEEFKAFIDRMFYLHMRAEAGTYIKEFVHSDFGRTEPSLATVLGGNCAADIIQLDVMEINIDWPPEVTYEDHN